MTFIIRQISLTADGREIVRSATLAKPQLSLGRASENDIHLPDLALDPDHARIEQLDPRTLRIRATGTLGFDIEGRTTRATDIDTAKGAELRFGGHRITVAREDDATILTIRRADAVSHASEEKEEAKVFSLRGLAPPKRLTAWGLVLAILIGFLAVPIYSYATRDSRNIYSVKGDGAWSSGPLSQAHHALEGKCETCHQKAFVSVRDSACQTCHKSVHDHAPAARIAMARAEPGIGGKLLASVASTFGKPPEGACVDCHREHEGAGPMQPTPQAFCTDCHGSLKDRLKDTKLANAGDFGTAHPQFSALVQYKPGQHPSFTRASLDANPRDDSGLKFPHDIHLSKTGGVARMARTLGRDFGGGDYGNALACKDCHKPTADGVRFLPVDMERDCQSCHSLAFETIGGTVRTLRHGQPEQVVADLRAYYRSTGPAQPVALGGMARRRPGDYAQGRVYHAYFGAAATRPSRADDAVRAVFSKGGACYDCHTITNNGSWQVTPVHQPVRYMMNGWFDHKAHRTETCESCHAAPKSHDARQLLLPKLDSCRTCHGGEKSKADVPSGCAMCHSYHADDGAPWTPAAQAVKNDRAKGGSD